jgi:L-ascorbate metabolism protein UlaG (beta-lactamase superfamily)
MTDQGKSMENSIQYIGHTTVLVSAKGLQLVFDPNFNKKIPMIKRQQEAVFNPLDLHKTQAIFYTNAHYHRLDLKSLKYFSLTSQIIIPIGISKIIKPSFPFHITELKEDAEMTMGESQVYAYKALYKAKRALNHYSNCLNYVVKTPSLTFCYISDTRYEGLYFYDMGKKHAIDVAFLPIDHVGPDSTARSRYLDIPKALQAFLDLGAKKLVPVCYGAFNFSHRNHEKFKEKLLKEAEKLNIADKMCLLAPGESLKV